MEVIYIPLVRDSQKRVGAILAAQFFENDTTYRILYASRYRDFGYDTSGHTQWNARNVFHLFALFDNAIFGYTKFIIKGDSVYKRKDDSTSVVLSFAQNDGTVGRGATLSQVTVCNTFVHCDIILSPTGGCNCVRTSSSSECYSIELCTSYYYEWGTGGGSSGWGGIGSGNGGTGGGSMGGGSGGWWSGDPCSGGNGGRVMQPEPNGCGGVGWSPILLDANDDLPEIESIIDSLLSQCLKNTLSGLIANNYSNEISSMLNSIWGATADCNVKFLETDTLPWNIDGATNTRVRNGLTTHTIKLNQPILDSASVEYVASTMFHEILHAYLNATGLYGNTVTHTAMANQYVDRLKNSLMTHFPSLDSTDAKALAWGGLQDTQGWDSIRVNHPSEYNDLRIRNARHRAHTAGNVCQ